MKQLHDYVAEMTEKYVQFTCVISTQL